MCVHYWLFIHCWSCFAFSYLVDHYEIILALLLIPVFLLHIISHICFFGNHFVIMNSCHISPSYPFWCIVPRLSAIACHSWFIIPFLLFIVYHSCCLYSMGIHNCIAIRDYDYLCMILLMVILCVSFFVYYTLLIIYYVTLIGLLIVYGSEVFFIVT